MVPLQGLGAEQLPGHCKLDLRFTHFTNHGLRARYVKSRVAHAPGMPGTFSPPQRVNDPDMHHGTCVPHVPWCMPGSLPSGFLWSRWRGKRSRHSRRMLNPQFYVSGKRPIDRYLEVFINHFLGSSPVSTLKQWAKISTHTTPHEDPGW